MINKKLGDNKKGWIKVVESFISIMLLASILFLVGGEIKTDAGYSSFFEDKQFELLQGIQKNDSLRTEVVGFTNYPLNSSSVGFPTGLKNYVNHSEIHGLSCMLRICKNDDECNLNLNSGSEIYTSKVLVTSNLTIFNPQIVKLFCN
jgi:hypothetical protein